MKALKKGTHQSQLEKNTTQKKFSLAEFTTAEGQIDYSKAENYNEDLVRSNLSRVKRPSSVVVMRPTLVKEKVYVPPTDYVEQNKICGHRGSRLNQKSIESLRAQLHSKPKKAQKIRITESPVKRAFVQSARKYTANYESAEVSQVSYSQRNPYALQIRQLTGRMSAEYNINEQDSL